MDEDCFTRLAMSHVRSRMQWYSSGPGSTMRSHLQAKDAYVASGRGGAGGRTGGF